MKRLTITNPLRGVDPTLVPNALAAYREVRHYGPAQTVDAPPAGANPASDHVRIAIDPGADAKHSGSLSEVRAIWEGDLSIAAVTGPTSPPDATTLVWLRLEMAVPSVSGGLRATLADRGVVRVPQCAYYGNVLYSTLRDAFSTRTTDELAPFLALAPIPGKLRVDTGQKLGKLGAITLDDGTQGVALDLKLAGSIVGDPPISPPHFFAQVAGLASDLLFEDSDRDPDLNVWSVCEPRHVIWLRDEWTRQFGAGRPAADGWSVAIGVRGSAGKTIATTVSPATADGEAALALDATWVPDPTASATVTMRYSDVRGAEDLFLSPVPADGPASDALSLPLALPGETMVQALRPGDWFPAQGGRRRDATAAAAVDVVVPVPHVAAPFTNGNLITPLVDGAAYFAELDDALATVTASDHWALQTGWWLDAELKLRSNSLHDHWHRILRAGGRVFALAWNPVGGPLSALQATMPAGPVRDLAGEIDDWEETLRLFLSFMVAGGSQSTVYAPNADAIALLFELGGEGILDGRHRPAASHHAKLAVLRGGAGLIAFVGGIDVNLDRVNSTVHNDYAPGTQPYHDVQCKIQGPAARDVVRTFISRWNDHPPSLGQPDAGNGKHSTLACALLGMTGGAGAVNLALSTDDDPQGGTYLAQIARTFGNTRGLKNFHILNDGTFTDDNGYGFAPDGDFTIESAILGAIKRARRYIYIEDQYLGSLKIATAVADRIRERRAEIEAGDPDGFFVYIVVPNFAATTYDVHRYSDAMALAADPMWQAAQPGPFFLARALERMIKSLPDKVDVGVVWPYLHSRWIDILESVDPTHEHWELFCLCLPPCRIVVPEAHPDVPGTVPGSELRPATAQERRVYIHAKVVLVDDIWATIGSANMNVRSYTQDAEINCCFIDGRTDDAGRRVGVRDLRAELWAEHTGIPAAWWSARDGGADGPTWRSLATGSDPRSARATTGVDPVGSRLYLWPKGAPDHLYASQEQTPRYSWSRNGAPVPLPQTGVKELPIYWWLSEGYGKEPWTTVRDDLMPPAIGSNRFAFDGEDGSAYEPYDLNRNQ